MFDPQVLDAALDADRTARKVLARDANRAALARSLAALHSWITSRQTRAGCAESADGKDWAHEVSRMQRTLKVADGRRAIRNAALTIIKELRPLSGAARGEREAIA